MHSHVVFSCVLLVLVVPIRVKQDELADDHPADEGLPGLCCQGCISLEIYAELGVVRQGVHEVTMDHFRSLPHIEEVLTILEQFGVPVDVQAVEPAQD